MNESLEALARRALAAYEIPGYSLRFIRHSDTVTHRVDVPGQGAWLLRLHVPVTRAMGDHGADPVAVRSEMQWLEALSRDTDLVLQAPVRNRSGDLVTPLDAGGGAPPVHCTLLRWVDGQPYHRDLESEATARQIGEILATLHHHASQWEMPEGFRRPKRDIAYFQGVLRGIRPALADGRISAADYAELETSVSLLADMMRSMDRDRASYGLMHADAHKGNLLLHEGQVRLIDFSFCAIGNYLFDLAVCLSDMREDLHRTCLAAYQDRRRLPEGHGRLVEGFFVGSMVGTFSFWVANPKAQEVLARKVPHIARTYAARFNRGERFWFG